MECQQVLRSFDLLQLRRDRIAKSAHIVERNQSLIIEMPGLLDKMVILLRLVNYGPELADLIKYNTVAQTPLTSDIFQFSPIPGIGITITLTLTLTLTLTRTLTLTAYRDM